MHRSGCVLGAVLGGLLAFFGDYPDPQALLYWLAPIPVLIAVLHSSPRESALLGALYGLVATGRVWLDFDVAPFAGRFVMSLLFAVIHGCVFWATRRLVGERNEALAPWVYASCVVCSEMIRELPSTGQWWTVAATQVDVTGLRATASLGGSFLVSFLVALGAAAVATVLARPGKDTVLSALGALAVIGGCVGWCAAHPPKAGRSVRVAAVSVGAPADIAERWYTERVWASADLWTIFERYEIATRKAAAAGAELVAWREFGFGVPGSERLRVEERIRELARETGAMVVAGFIDGTEFLNQALVAAPDGTTELYSKKHLVPMAESLWLQPGDRHHGWIEYGDLKIGVLICYDIDFGRSVRHAVRHGANLLVVPSADWPGIHQRHPLQGSLRSAEHAIPLVRPAEGLSTLIDASGAVIGRASDVDESEVILMDDLSLRGSTTVYTTTGNWIFGLSFLVLVGAWFESRRGARRLAVGQRPH